MLRHERTDGLGTKVWSLRDLCRRELLLLFIGGLLLGSFILVWAISYLNSITPEGIVIHHTSAIPPILHLRASTGDRLPLNLNAWDEFHQERGFGAFYWGRIYHIGYHYVIFPDGTVKHGRPERCVGAHTKGFNRYLGIALVGDFNQKNHLHGTAIPSEPTREQMQALVTLCRQLRVRYKISLEGIIPHNAVARTKCPGDRFPFKEFVRQIQ